MARRKELRRRERQAMAEDRVLQSRRREEARAQEREAARRLGMGLSSLYRKIADLGIHTGAGGEPPAD